MLFIKGWQTIKEQPVAQFIMTHTLWSMGNSLCPLDRGLRLRAVQRLLILCRNLPLKHGDYHQNATCSITAAGSIVMPDLCLNSCAHYSVDFVGYSTAFFRSGIAGFGPKATAM